MSRRLLLAVSFAVGLVAPGSAQPPGVGQPPAGDAFAPAGVFAPPPANLGPNGGLFPPAPPPPKIWTGSIEAGLNGATGNTELFNGRVGWNANRKTPDNFFHSDFLYTYANQNGGVTQNVGLFNARDEILFAGSPWTLFGSTNIEYDQLRLYHFRVGVYGGVGYTVLDDGDSLFKVRAGAGAVREIGGPKDRWVPELVFGYDLNHKITDRQSFFSNLDFYPRVDDFAKFRVRAKIGYEVILDPATGLAFRIGAQSRYDSDPGAGFKRHDLNYFATLAVKF